MQSDCNESIQTQLGLVYSIIDKAYLLDICPFALSYISQWREGTFIKQTVDARVRYDCLPLRLWIDENNEITSTAAWCKNEITVQCSLPMVLICALCGVVSTRKKRKQSELYNCYKVISHLCKVTAPPTRIQLCHFPWNIHVNVYM